MRQQVFQASTVLGGFLVGLMMLAVAVTTISGQQDKPPTPTPPARMEIIEPFPPKDKYPLPPDQKQIAGDRSMHRLELELEQAALQKLQKEKEKADQKRIAEEGLIKAILRLESELAALRKEFEEYKKAAQTALATQAQQLESQIVKSDKTIRDQLKEAVQFEETGRKENLSVVNVPITIELQKLRMIVNEKVPRQIDFREEGDWTPAGDERIEGHIGRSEIQVAVEEDGTIVLTTPLSGFAKWAGKTLWFWTVVPTKELSGKARLSAKVTFDPRTWNPQILDRDFQLTMDVERAFLRIKVLVFDGSINIRGLAQGAADRAVGNIRGQIFTGLNGAMPNVHAQVAKLSKEAQEGVLIGKGPPVWLRIQPVEAWLVPPKRQGDQIVSQAGIACRLTTAVSETRPANWKADAPVPELRNEPPSGIGKGFKLVLPVEVSWKVIEQELQNLSQKKPLKIEDPDGGFILIQEVLSIGPAGEAGGIQAEVRGVQVRLKSLNFDTKDNVTARFDLMYDSKQKRLAVKLPPGGVNLASDIVTIVAMAMARPFIDALNVRLAAELDNAPNLLTQLAKEAAQQLKNIGLSVNFQEVELQELRFGKEKAYLQGFIGGTAELHLDLR
ncbi:MAG: DUF4403 family protein [Thermoguttaceae bacterium]|nr:DUF4403 family protein [Thermoguttaceae bacterium]MDW8037378.1 DUF4403 family protein [Thermoguttaceae bacterium]